MRYPDRQLITSCSAKWSACLFRSEQCSNWEVAMKRRTFLVGGASAVATASAQPASSQSPPVPGQPLAAGDLASAAARLRAQFLKEFEPAYVENVIVPHFLVSVYKGERP